MNTNWLLRMAAVSVCIVFLSAVGAGAQNISEIGTAATEKEVEEEYGDVPFIVESLDAAQKEERTLNPEIEALVDRSQIPDVAPSPESSSRYTLGPTDVIEIAVLRHEEVSGTYIINKEGKIQYEFVGDVKVSGMTKDEVAKVLAQRLENYVIAPEVNVKITGYNSKICYVVGEVAAPGKIYMRGDTITVREALMQAGLPMLSGVTKKSRLITPSEKGKGAKKDINVYALLYEGDLRENAIMKPGDVLYIPPTFLTKAMRAISPVAAPIGTAAGTGRTLTTGF